MQNGIPAKDAIFLFRRHSELVSESVLVDMLKQVQHNELN